MLRPGQLLALHRRGLLLSSFHPMSHLTGTSSITTRAINQFPAAGLSPAGHAALRAANREHRDKAENSAFLCVLCVLCDLCVSLIVGGFSFKFWFWSAVC